MEEETRLVNKISAPLVGHGEDQVTGWLWPGVFGASMNARKHALITLERVCSRECTLIACSPTHSTETMCMHARNATNGECGINRIMHCPSGKHLPRLPQALIRFNESVRPRFFANIRDPDPGLLSCTVATEKNRQECR